jgi:glycosyltransferase involved in cell wall biosynthesis
MSIAFDPEESVTHALKQIRGLWESGERPGKVQPAHRPKRIICEGPQFANHSFALINRELCLQLIDSGYEVSTIPGNEVDNISPDSDQRFAKIVQRTRKTLSGGTDIHIRHQWPPNFTPPPEGHWVMIQPWEYGRLPENWIAPMTNLVDELWVPSSHVEKTYIASGIPADRVIVMPNGVNTDQFYPLYRTGHTESKKFRFLFVGGFLWRKGIDILLRAYSEVFDKREDVILIIKDFPAKSRYLDQGASEMLGEIQKKGNVPEIMHYAEMLEAKRMPALYQARGLACQFWRPWPAVSQ